MFSELVDTVLARCGRTDRKEDIISYVNLTIRSVQAKIFCYNNLTEDQIEATADPFIWINPINFQKLKAARYNDGEYPVSKMGKGQDTYPNRYYLGPGYVGFTGMEVGSLIDVAYYKFQPRLKYYEDNQRPATTEFNYTTEQYNFSYYDLTSIGDLDYTLVANQPLARAKVSNWILLKWREMIEEGTLAKVYKLIGETERAATAFSLFERTRVQEFEPTENDSPYPGQAA